MIDIDFFRENESTNLRKHLIGPKQ